ncbi:MAG: 30S ribosomal protein S2 [Thermocladium sp.]|jgi:SSU ribosomal protein S2P|nr:MAG: 30S ribosomal protein S2 [Thermocladium sp. ECH_B]
MSDKKEEQVSGEELLVPIEKYMAAGVRLGAKISNNYLIKRGFIFSVRPDGLRIFNLKKIDERIRIAAKMMTRYDPSKIVAHSVKPYGFKPMEMMCKFVGCKVVAGRFIPGSFTNPSLDNYMDAELLIIADPKTDIQSLKEAAATGIPVIGLVDTDNDPNYIDLMIPCNNKGRGSLALIFWLLTRQVLRERGEIPPTGDLPVSPDDFKAKATPQIQ